jgi:hypothetical protein
MQGQLAIDQKGEPFGGVPITPGKAAQSGARGVSLVGGHALRGQ